MGDRRQRGNEVWEQLPVRSRRSARAALVAALVSALCLAPGRPGLAGEGDEIPAPGSPDRTEQLSSSLAAVLPGLSAQQTAELARALAGGVPAPNLLRQFAPVLRQVAQGSLSELADRLETPGNRLNYEISGSKKLGGGFSGTGGVGSDGGKLGASLGLANLELASFSVSSNPGDRSHGATVSYGPTIHLEPGVEFRYVYSVKFSYRTNRDYIDTGLTAIPGTRTVLQILDGTFGKARAASGGTVENAAQAALVSVRNTVLPNSEAMQKYDSVTTGAGFEITVSGEHPALGLGKLSPAGAVKFTHLDMERIRRGESRDQAIAFSQESVGLELTGRFGVPAAGGAAGAKAAAASAGQVSRLLDQGKVSVSLALAHSTDPDEQTPDPALAGVAQRLRDGRIGQVIEAAAGQSAPLWDGERIRRALKQLVGGCRRLADPARIVAVKEKVGGVMVYYDPAILANAVPAGELAASLQQLALNEQQGKTSVSIRLDGREESFVTLSLKAWLSSGARTVGGLTRIRGYVRKPDDLILIGQAEPDRPVIDADVLTVALASVYRRGTTPFVSLDPDPYDPYGLQKPRVGGVPPQLSQTEFVRVMLDADYDMKRINLGELTVAVPGFRSWFEILRQSRPDDTGMRRFWLRPMWTGAGDVLEHGPAVIFESNVEVLTERMKQVGDYMTPDPIPSPGDDAAADELTRHYAEIERQLDSFYRLHALFDVTKLCAILRYRGVRSPILDAIARRAVRSVRRADGKGVLASYAGIGPKLVEGTSLVIGGGAVAKAGLTRSAFAPSAALGDLLQGKTTLTLERSVPLSRTAHPEMLLGAAIQDFAENRLRECEQKTSRALSEDPDLANAHVYRALARFGLGKRQPALADLNLAVGAEPSIIGFRGVVKLYLGDVAGARRDVEAAVRSHPELESVWEWSAMVKLYSLDFRGATAAIDRLFDFHATSIEGYQLRALAQLLRRMGPQEAKRRTQMLLGLPVPLAQAFTDGYTALLMFDAQGAAQDLRRALRLSRQLAGNPNVRGFYARERALFMLAVAESGALTFGQAGDPSRRAPGIACADELIRLHPSWASGYLLKALCVLRARAAGPGLEPRSLIGQGFSRGCSSDPLLQDWSILFGAENLKPYFYAMASFMSAKSGHDPRPYLAELGKEQSAAGQLARAVLVIFGAAHDPRAGRHLRTMADSVIGGKPGNDPASIILYSMFLLGYCHVAIEGGEPERGLKAARALIANLPPDHPTYEGLGLIGLFRCMGMSSLGDAYEEWSHQDRELRALAAAAARGKIDVTAIRRRVSELTSRANQESARNDSAFVHAFLASLSEVQRSDLQYWALDRARDALRRAATLSPDRKQQIDASLSQAATELDARREASAKNRAAEWKRMFDAWLARARTPADLRTLEVVSQRFTMRAMLIQDPAEAARLQGAISLLTAKIRLKSLRRWDQAAR